MPSQSLWYQKFYPQPTPTSIAQKMLSSQFAQPQQPQAAVSELSGNSFGLLPMTKPITQFETPALSMVNNFSLNQSEQSKQKSAL